MEKSISLVSYQEMFLVVGTVQVWKIVQTSGRHPVTDTGPVNPIFQAVDFGARSGSPEKFTSFLIMNILPKPLSSTETIAKLVEKPVQISVRLAQFRNLIN